MEVLSLGPGAGISSDIDQAKLDCFLRLFGAAARPSAVIAYEEMNGQIDIRDILLAIHVPTLIMNRTGDPVAHVEAARVGCQADFAIRLDFDPDDLALVEGDLHA